MALNDHKIANLTSPIESLPDHPSADGINAETLKKAFDKSPNEIKDKLNDVIDNLLSNTDNDSGADNIGSTAISGITGDTVQAQMEALKAFIDAAILGYINDGTITDDKLSNAPGQIKERINSLDADKVNKAGDDMSGALRLRSSRLLSAADLNSTGTSFEGTKIITPYIVKATTNPIYLKIVGGEVTLNVIYLKFNPTADFYRAEACVVGTNKPVITLAVENGFIIVHISNALGYSGIALDVMARTTPNRGGWSIIMNEAISSGATNQKIVPYLA